VIPENQEEPRHPHELPHYAFVERAMAVHESALIRYATTLLNDSELARDVVQDTFLKLCKQRESAVRPRLKAWLFKVCRNRAYDHLRKAKRTERLDEIKWAKFSAENAAPDESALQQERFERAMRMLERLPRNQRDVIILKLQQGLSYKEIRQVTGLSEGNIGFLLHTGLKRLRGLLDDAS